MSNFVVIADSASDATADLREKVGIAAYAKTILYYPDGSEHAIDVDDNSELSLEDFFGSMKGRKTMYNTAAPAHGDIVATMEQFLSQGKDVLALTLSTGLSATFHEYNLAAEELRPKYPERKIVVVDSLCYSTMIVLLLSLAKEKIEAGASIEEVAEFLNDKKYCIHQMGGLDDLFFAAHHGRVSNFKAFMGTMAGINMLAEVNEKGSPEVIGRAKGKKDANRFTVEYVKRTIINPTEQTLYIAHSNRKENAELLAASLKEALNPKDVIVTDLGKPCGASIGPGLCVCYYEGIRKEAGMEAEKKIMAEVLASAKAK